MLILRMVRVTSSSRLGFDGATRAVTDDRSLLSAPAFVFDVTSNRYFFPESSGSTMNDEFFVVSTRTRSSIPEDVSMSNVLIPYVEAPGKKKRERYYLNRQQ